MKYYSGFLLLLLLIKTISADVFSQLQFIKIVSPTNDQSIHLGDKVIIKYVMQPLIFEHTSNGYAKNLTIDFHKRSGNSKKEKILTIDPNCPVAANKNSYKTYKKEWIVPTNLTPGSYAFNFIEQVQLRRGEMTAAELVKVNIVD